jgi:carboxymethylenebutenolidase
MISSCRLLPGEVAVMVAVSRRAALIALAGVPLATRLLRPDRAAWAETVGEAVTISGGGSVSAVASFPAVVPAPAVMSIHGAFGSSNWYKSRAGALADAGFVGLAVDLFDGEVADDEPRATALRQRAVTNFHRTMEIVVSWADWLKGDQRTTGKLGAIGFSFGAECVLEAATRTPIDAAVLYYGASDIVKAELAKIKGPLLGHFAESDDLFPARLVKRFEAKAREAGLSPEIYWYAAKHSFANPEFPGYDPAAAELAWERTVKFLRSSLG